MLCRNLSCICTRDAVIAINCDNDQEVDQGKIGIRLSPCDLRPRCQRGCERVLALSDDGALISSPRLGDRTVLHRNGVISYLVILS